MSDSLRIAVRGHGWYVVGPDHADRVLRDRSAPTTYHLPPTTITGAPAPKATVGP